MDVYKDTVYDDTLITGNEKYTSFIYLDRKTDKYDTLTNFTAEKSGDSGPCDSVPIYCLREFSKQTLFIVVTHNKRTMAEADMLYGVTQEIKGISRIASVQLADATKFAI